MSKTTRIAETGGITSSQLKAKQNKNNMQNI